jgi:magnesium chelatase subunit I
VEVSTPGTAADRVEVLRRRDGFDTDPAGFLGQWAAAERELGSRILAARVRLGSMVTPDTVLELAAHLCIALGTDGLRGELTLLRAARALAAFDGAEVIAATHLRRVALPALRHRLRRNPLDEAGAGPRVERALVDLFGAT